LPAERLFKDYASCNSKRKARLMRIKAGIRGNARHGWMKAARAIRSYQISECPSSFDQQMDPKAWPDLKQKLVEVFKTRTRDEWCAIMEGTDVCFAPILTMREAPQHPHNAAREIWRGNASVFHRLCTRNVPASQFVLSSLPGKPFSNHASSFCRVLCPLLLKEPAQRD
jgi:crotonobetainyl-CoA:carnitine CoA-transferase CaiB-like acyl-CoA transferase